MERRPITKVRSEWVPLAPMLIGEVEAATYGRRVHDGWLHVICGPEPDGFHLSISHQPQGQRSRPRYPTWDEIAEARYRFCPAEVTMAMLLPPLDDYVALHDTAFHLHELPDSEDAKRSSGD